MKNLFTLLTAQALLLAAPAPPAAARGQQPPPAAATRQQQTPPAQQPAPAPRTQETPRPSPSPVEIGEDEVVRITTSLVQLDVVVTDKRGRHVTDLKAEDFVITEDGRPQQITNFSYVSITPPAAPAPARPTPASPAEAPPPVPARRLAPGEVRRTMALVVDDLGLSFTSMHDTRRALRKFVDEQMGPNDLVAIVRTAGGVGALQQFTSDRRVLHAAIERIRWYPAGRAGVGPFAAAEPEEEGDYSGSGSGGRTEEETRRARAAAADFREEVFAVGTLGAVNHVVRGMRELPGRKSVILYSDGFSLFRPDAEQRERLMRALRRLVDLSMRASVVIYAVDPRGLVYTGPTAADSFGSPQQMAAIMAMRNRTLIETQEGPAFLAQETGGLAFRNTNDIAGATRKAVEDQSGYYLIAYRPAGETFDRRFHSISAKVRGRSGLTVRTRKGFFGVSEEELRPAQPTGDRRLIAALLSPFSASGVGVRLSAFFTADAQFNPVVGSTMHLDARDLKFEPAADGWQEAKLDISAVAFGANGAVVDQHHLTQTLRLRGDTYERAMRGGIVYTFNVPVKRAGAYQLRTAVRDTATGRIGTSSQFIEVPDLTKDRLTMSGLVVAGSPLQSATPATPRAPGAQQSTPGAAGQQPRGAAEPLADPEATHAVRRFRQKTYLDFAYFVFNARADRAAGGLPQLTAQTRLFRDGRAVFTGDARPIPLAGQPDPRRVTGGGRILLGTELEPGEYVLQIVVTDALRKDKRRTAAQWVDFEIVK